MHILHIISELLIPGDTGSSIHLCETGHAAAAGVAEPLLREVPRRFHIALHPKTHCRVPKNHSNSTRI